jgi:hypothetical protein
VIVMTPPPPVPASASPASAPAAPRRSFFRRLWSLLVFLIVVGAWGASAYLYRELQRERAARAQLAQTVAEFDPRFERFKQAVRDVDRRLSSSVFQEVDLSAGGWQPIAGGFYVIDLSVTPQADGVKIAGKVINPTSVTHDSAQLSARVSGHRATFGLAHVPPSIAQPFEVLVPGVAPADAKRAYFALESSTISFSSSTTRKHSGADPVDTDKALK